ncbi:diphthine--ammonia ligase [Mucilaginibacter koreensis]
MKNKIKCFFSWSGGKDSSLALYRVLQNPAYEICYLLTTVNDAANRISMHGVREELLMQQAESIGIPLYQIRLPEMPDMETYDQVMHQHYLKFKQEGITHAVYGDIFLQDLKDYRDARLSAAGISGVYPLWQQDTRVLLDEFWNLGFRTIIACTQASLGNIAGEELTADLIDSLPANVDVCGENGEFHTFAFEGPIFKEPIKVKKGEKVFKSFQVPKQQDGVHQNTPLPEVAGFWYCDLLPA